MAVFLAQSFVKYLPIRLSRACAYSGRSSSTGTRSYVPKQVILEETTAEILHQILSSDVAPSVSREEICVGFIQKLCAAGNLPVAARLLHILRSKHILVGPRTYDYLLEAADRNNDIHILSQVFKDFLVSCQSLRSTSYLIVGRAFGRHGDHAILLNLIRELWELELPRVDIVLNRLIFALAKCGFVDRALLVFDQMKSSECKPDLVTYNTVLAIFGRLGRVDDMLREFALMKTINVIPDAVTYNTILNCLRKMGRLDLCLIYYKEMSDRGIQPDVLTFKALIESLGRSGNIEDALKIFYGMKCKQIFPSIHVYRALIFCLKRMGKTELVLKFSTEMNKVFPINFHHKNR